MNSKNSTIVHQCEALPSSARPLVNNDAHQVQARSSSKFKKTKTNKKTYQPQMSFS
jgi:hypothetical protein